MTERQREHDPIYRRIFNRARIVEEILRRFATGPWAAHLDFSTLEPVPADFVTKYLRKREADLIWRVRHGPGAGDWFYVFVLMELQSTVERFMALRLLVYVLHLCEALIRHKGYLAARHPRRLLPPVLAVVLYNGEKPWTAPLSLAELFKPMAGYAPPDFKYVVLDVNRYRPEELRPVEDVVSEEVRMSLLQRAEKWTQQWKAEGEAKGKAEGRRLGKAEALKNQAHRRFGELPAWAVDRVDRADVDTLDRWFYRILDATVLEDVFEDAE